MNRYVDWLANVQSTGWFERSGHKLFAHDFGQFVLCFDAGGTTSDETGLSRAWSALDELLHDMIPIDASAVPPQIKSSYRADKAAYRKRKRKRTKAIIPTVNGGAVIEWRSGTGYLCSLDTAAALQWTGPRFKVEPPEPLAGEVYDYRGHATAPTAISCRLIALVASALGRNKLANELSAAPEPATADGQFDKIVSQSNSRASDASSSRRTRSDYLTDEISVILKRWPDATPADVMTTLKKSAGASESCVYEVTQRGLSYKTAGNKIKDFGHAALTDRIYRIRNPK